MSELVERVARAIERVRIEIAAERAWGKPIGTMAESERAARAAIQVMREPTQTMSARGGWITIESHEGVYEQDVGEYHANQVWAAMVGAALEDPK